MTTAAFLSVLIHLWTRLVLSDQSSSLLLCSSSLQLLFSVHVNFRSPFIFPHDIQGNIAVFLQNLDSFILRTASPSQKSLHIFHQKPLNLPPKKILLNSFSIDCQFCHITWTTLRMPLKEEQSNIPGVTHWIPWNNCFLCDVIILLALSLQIFCTQLFIFHRCSTVRIIVIKQFPIPLVFLIES